MSLAFAADELAELDRRGLRRSLRTVSGPLGRVIELDGRVVVNVSSNDYLGLAAEPALARAAARAAERAGTGAGASRLIVGNTTEHEALEAELARFFGRERALLFNSGYQANVGVLQAFAGPGDVIISDALNHASIIDGCRLSRAAVEVAPHADVDAVDRLLASWQGRARRMFVVTDGLFSMDGDYAPLAGLERVARARGAALIVDEAHAVGVVGDGRGVAAAVGVRPDLLVGTLGKAFGSFGAFAVGDTAAIELLVNRARSFVFTTALPAPVVAASRAALELVSGPEGARRRAHLAALSRRLGAALRAGDSDNSAIISHICPIVVGAEEHAMACAEALLEAGYYAQGIRPPTVPAGTARLRIALSAAHTESDVDGLMAALRALRDRGLVTWRA